ncbi:hypothetical protein [Spirulina subsalsa]|uniref:hypothetical protein n=1 Tax=Spirulina subsalsa TaxID=54311 RepID=UPI001ED99F01|nr:hypothetical protein [Spirulina subsalsa]
MEPIKGVCGGVLTRCGVVFPSLNPLKAESGEGNLGALACLTRCDRLVHNRKVDLTLGVLEQSQ